MDLEHWIEAARRVRLRAYAPYSQFAVGAALVATDGRVFSGCNIENISFGLTMCAERVALGLAVAEGVSTFSDIVILADTKVPVSPCGACRQVLAEFASDLRVHLVSLSGGRESFHLHDLLPRASTGILDRP